MLYKEGDNPSISQSAYETYEYYLRSQSGWVSAEERTKYPDDPEAVLTAIRERVHTHPRVYVIEDNQTRLASVGEYDRTDIAIASRTPLNSRDAMNSLALEVFEGFYDPAEYHGSVKPIANGLLTSPNFPELLLPESPSSEFPLLAKRLPSAFVEQRVGYSIVSSPTVVVPAEAQVELEKPEQVFYKPFLWRTIAVRLFPDVQIARIFLDPTSKG